MNGLVEPTVAGLRTLKPDVRKVRILHYGTNMRPLRALILILIAQISFAALAQTQSPSLIGRWIVEITFGKEDHHSLRFDAQAAGKGTFLLLDPQSRVWVGAKASQATWTQGEGNAVTFSGPVEFLIGNVGREPGTLVFKGEFKTPDLITGKVEFSPLIGQRPKVGSDGQRRVASQINWAPGTGREGTDIDGRLLVTVLSGDSAGRSVPNSTYAARFKDERKLWDQLGQTAAPVAAASAAPSKYGTFRATRARE
jgi:hypothetical protein